MSYTDMERVIIHNLTSQNAKSIEAVYCSSFLCRSRGLAFRTRIPDELGLLMIHDSDSRLFSPITMLGVFFTLAVVWIDSEKNVVDVVEALPWRLIYIPRNPARYILEMNSSKLDYFQIGDRVRIERITFNTIE